MKRSRTKKIFLFNSFMTEVCFINQFINLQSKASVVEDLKKPQDDSAEMQFVEKKKPRRKLTYQTHVTTVWWGIAHQSSIILSL